MANVSNTDKERLNLVFFLQLGGFFATFSDHAHFCITTISKGKTRLPKTQ
jgi:hypothetical protein